MTTSGRRPANKDSGKPSSTSSGKSSSPKGTTSGRKPAPSAGAARPPAAARPRARADEDGEVEPPSGAKQAMFFGTIALVVIVLVLVVVKWEALTTDPPKNTGPKVIKDQDAFDKVNAIRDKANKQFIDATKIKDTKARNAAIHAAIDTLTTAQDKLQELSESPRYKGKEEYDQNFEEIQNKISIDMKKWRDAIRMGE